MLWRASSALGYAIFVANATLVEGLVKLSPRAKLVESSPARDKIVYVKTHSTGSSTLTNLMHRYCDNYGKECYVPLLPGEMCCEPCLKTIAKQVAEAHLRFDVWPNHVVYAPDLLEAVVPGGVAISIFREPFSRVMSAFAHGGGASVELALGSLQRNEPYASCGLSGTRVTMQVSLTNFYKLDFVLITEEYNLGLVLMRRYLGWKLEDIVYLRMKDHTATTADLVAPLREYLSLDDAHLTEAAVSFKERCMRGDEAELYRRANATFWEQYGRLDPAERREVGAEVKLLEETLQRVQDCCEAADPGDLFCKSLTMDNVEWVQDHNRSLSLLRRQRQGCHSLVPDV